jgi:hypothetical protein
MVRVEVPVGVPVLVATVSVELVPALMDVELKEAVVPLGCPMTDKFTVPVNPFNALVLIV